MRQAGSRVRMRRPFWGWWVVGGSMVHFTLQTATFGLVFGQYLLLVRDTFGWSKSAISGAFSAAQLIAGVISPGHGWLIDRFSPKNVTRLGVVMFGGGFLIMPLVNQLWQFVAVILLIALGTSFAGFLTLQVAIANWFRRNRGKAMAISSMGVGLGGLTAPIVAWALVTHGWRPTAFATGIAVLLIGLPAAQLIRTRPEEMGLVPDGGPARPGDAPPARHEIGMADFTVREALADRSFWYVGMGHGVALIAVFMVMVHLVPHLVEDAGWSKISAQTMIAVVTVAQLTGQLVGGFLGDRYSKIRIAGLAMLAHATGMLLFAMTNMAPIVVLAALLHGAGWGLRGPLMMAIRADYYGRAHFGKIAGYANVMVMIGPLVGPVLGGTMSDAFGDYSGAFYVTAAITGLGSMLFFFARKPPLPKRLREAEAEA